MAMFTIARTSIVQMRQPNHTNCLGTFGLIKASVLVFRKQF